MRDRNEEARAVEMEIVNHHDAAWADAAVHVGQYVHCALVRVRVEAQQRELPHRPDDALSMGAKADCERPTDALDEVCEGRL